jgi:hypothetical protein
LKFQTVTIETARGIVGVDRVSDFPLLVGEPDYPLLEWTASNVSLIVAIALAVAAAASGGVFAAAAFSRTRPMSDDSLSPQGPLYDQPELAAAESDEASERLPRPADDPPNPCANPYDDGATCDL